MLDFYNWLFDNIFMCWILLIAWFTLLIKGADYLVEWSSSIAYKYWLSQLVIWLTIVAFGTSMPELVVNVVAAIKWNKETLDIAISWILWSNLSNILLILWVTAIIYPLQMVASTVYREIPFSLLAVLVLFFLMSDNLINGYWESLLARNEALVLLGIFIIFLYYSYYLAKWWRVSVWIEIKTYSTFFSIIFIVGWLAGLVLGGNLVVNSAVNIAISFGVSSSVIWLTIVALWTSLPELATSVVAAYKKKPDMAVGNIVWSNIFNIVWILAITGIITPLKIYDWFYTDIGLTIIATFMLFVFSLTWKKYFINRIEWIILVMIYFSYMIYIVMINT